MDENEARARVVNCARGWIGTPYHHAARVKGIGVDCLTLLAEVFHEAGILTEPVKIPYYPPDWHLHRDAERYMDGLLQYARELPEDESPKPGDITLWKFGRCFSHGAIIVSWPLVVHAYVNSRVVMEHADKATWLNSIGESEPERGRPRPRKFFSYWR